MKFGLLETALRPLSATRAPSPDGGYALAKQVALGARRADEGLATSSLLSELGIMDKSPKALAHARNLRGAETEAERRLWGYLRDRRLSGYKFRRQVPIAPYIADFVCLSHGLVVEVDGATHGDTHEVEYDARRTEFLRSKGFAAHRVQNIDVLTNKSAVLDGILIVLKQQRQR